MARPLEQPDAPFRTVLRIPRRLANAATHAARFHRRSLNTELLLYTQLGVSLSAYFALRKQPDAPGAGESLERLEHEIGMIGQAAFGEHFGPKLIAAVAAMAEDGLDVYETDVASMPTVGLAVNP